MHRRLRKFSWAVSAVVLLAIVRAALTFLSYAKLRRILPRRDPPRDPPKEVMDRCAWALTRGSRVVPGASCLTQAVAGWWALNILGYRSRIIIGVRPVEGGGLAAHAWLNAAEGTIVGGDQEDLERFHRLTELQTSS